MNLLFRLKRLLARWLLRGRFLNWWVLRRGRQVDAAYRLALTKESEVSKRRRPELAFGRGDQLRRILFVADCLWEKHDLIPELSRIADCRVLDLRAALGNLPEGPAGRSAVVEAVRDFGKAHCSFLPDLVFFYLRPGMLCDDVFDLLRRQWKAPVFGMNLDDKMEFFPYGIFTSGNQNYMHWAEKFDLNITNCLPAVDWYSARGLPCLYSPPGVRLAPGLTMPDSQGFKYKISFLGQMKAERRKIVNELRAATVPIQLFGHGWPDSQWVENPTTVFRSSQINLGIGFASPSTSLTTVKARDFECPGVGACYLTSYNWELPIHFELGKEILCYRSVDELIEMYFWYHNRPDECLKIAQAAWRRCQAEHTWEHRLRVIFRKAGFRCR